MQKDNEKTLGSWEGFINKPTEQLSGGEGEQREAAVQRGSAQLLGSPCPLMSSCSSTPVREAVYPLDICYFLLVPGVQLALASIPYKNS